MIAPERVLVFILVLASSTGTRIYQEHLKPLGSSPPLMSIPVMESLPSPQYFYTWFHKPGVPVLFRSALNNPEFTYPAYKLWTDEYLEEKYGEVEASMEHNKKETRDFQDFHVNLFKDFLHTYNTSNVYMVHDLTEEPAMMEDVYLPPFLRCGGTQKLMTIYNMWFSGGGTKSVLHGDSYDNINCLLDGTKDIIFFDKRHYADVEADGWVEERGYSTMDVDSVDLDEFPRFKSLPWIQATMKKGDCLFLPRFWYHQVYSHEGRNLALNQWFDRPLVFNETECQESNQSATSLALSNFPLYRGDEHIRTTLFNRIENPTFVTEKNLEELLTNKKDAKEMHVYLDADGDGQVSWGEVQQVRVQDLLQTFRSRFTEMAQEAIATAEHGPPAYKEWPPEEEDEGQGEGDNEGQGEEEKKIHGEGSSDLLTEAKRPKSKEEL